MRAPNISNECVSATPTRTARGYLGHKRPTWERADLAAQAYAQRRPIEAPQYSTPAQRQAQAHPRRSARARISYGARRSCGSDRSRGGLGSNDLTAHR